MNEKRYPLNQQTRQRFFQTIKAFAASEVGGRAVLLFLLLISLLLSVSGLNVVNSYVGRDFMTAIAERNRSGFYFEAFIYICVFAGSTIVAVFLRWAEESLGLLFREWLTKRYVDFYLENRTYYRLKTGSSIDNPDERIADDVRAFTVTTLSFLLMLLNGSITVIAFSGVMWSISPALLTIAILYAAMGSYLAFYLGRPLVGLNFNQLDKEANFRSTLIHVRENAVSIALTRREGRLGVRLQHRIDEFAANFRRIIAVNRNLGFFTTGYNYLIQIIPALVVAPLFISGQVEFGVVTQSAMAFTMLVGAFSLIVTQFQPISSYTAVISRLGLLWEAMEESQSFDLSSLNIQEEEGHITYDHLTLHSPENNRELLKDLCITIPHGTRLLITGPNDAAKLALFRVTADIWSLGEGKIVRPSLDHIRFLPQRPYLYPGTLRELLSRSGEEHSMSDEQILNVLNELGLNEVLSRAGGLDVEQDWASILSLGEEQLLAFTRLLLAAPQFAFLDRVCTALSPEQVQQILLMLSINSITYIALEEAENLLELYDAVLEIGLDGSWKWKTIIGGRIIE